MRKLKRIVLTNAHNFRDLGGYTTKDEKATRWHRLYRSDTLQNLTDEEWKFLYTPNGLSLRMVVDLRSKAEISKNKLVIPKDCQGLVYKSCPIEFGEGENVVDQLAESKGEVYIQKFDENVKSFSRALMTIIDGIEERGQVVFQCTTGNDRTGILTAIILYLIKVYDEDIIADYEVSSIYNENGVNAYLRTLYGEINEDKLKSEALTMKTLLEHFKEINLEAVLAKNGLNEKKIEKLYTYFVD